MRRTVCVCNRSNLRRTEVRRGNKFGVTIFYSVQLISLSVLIPHFTRDVTTGSSSASLKSEPVHVYLHVAINFRLRAQWVFCFPGQQWWRGRRRVEKAHDLWLEEPSWSNWLFSFRSVSHSALAVDRFRLAPSFIGRQRSDRVIHNLTLPVSLSPVPSSDCLQHYLGSFLSGWLTGRWNPNLMWRDMDWFDRGGVSLVWRPGK